MQTRVGITFIYVTHDQEEALTMSDRIGVMDRGKLLQVGVPEDVYEAPITASSRTSSASTNYLEGHWSPSVGNTARWRLSRACSSWANTTRDLHLGSAGDRGIASRKDQPERR